MAASKSNIVKQGFPNTSATQIMGGLALAKATLGTPGYRPDYASPYPNGIPEGIKLFSSASSEGAQAYVEDHLPMGFYRNAPLDARAMFSTENGRHGLRNVDHILPMRHLQLWTGEHVQAVCNTIRKIYWQEMKHMEQPTRWEDLWNYFDAHDIYFQGALNLWNVVNHLYHENQFIIRDWHAAIDFELGMWVDNWASIDANKKKLRDWNGESDITSVFGPKDWMACRGLYEYELSRIQSCLLHRHSLLFKEPSDVATPYPNNTLMENYNSSTIQNWLAEARGPANNGIPLMEQIGTKQVVAGQTVVIAHGTRVSRKPEQSTVSAAKPSYSIIDGPKDILVKDPKVDYTRPATAPASKSAIQSAYPPPPTTTGNIESSDVLPIKGQDIAAISDKSIATLTKLAEAAQITQITQAAETEANMATETTEITTPTPGVYAHERKKQDTSTPKKTTNSSPAICSPSSARSKKARKDHGKTYRQKNNNKKPKLTGSPRSPNGQTNSILPSAVEAYQGDSFGKGTFLHDGAAVFFFFSSSHSLLLVFLILSFPFSANLSLK
jgi:hypothetical protein